MSTPSRRVVALCCCLLAPVTAALAALPSQYRLQTLDNGYIMSHVAKSGVVSGSDAQGEPAIWIGGVEHLLANPGNSGDAMWVNASNEAGGYIMQVNVAHASRWTAAGAWIDVGTAIPGSSTTTALSDVGDCAVDAALADRDHSYFSAGCQAGTMVDIGTLGGSVTTSGINTNGQVVGTSDIGVSAHPFIYAQGHMTDLGVMRNYDACEGKGINGRGHVVGLCAGARHKLVGYFYDGTRMRNIGNLGRNRTIAYAVNYVDIVVGESSHTGLDREAFVIDMGTPGSPMRDLNDMLDGSGAGWHLQSAAAINTAGEIIVVGTIDFQQGSHYAVLVPIN
jgi:probable HAF family extracellular repeat protein